MEYTCQACRRTLERGWTDEEARAESVTLFGQRDDLAIVCDDCFKSMAKTFGWPIEEEN